MLRGITARMGFLVYMGRYFQALLYPFFGKLPIVSMVRARVRVPPSTRRPV